MATLDPGLLADLFDSLVLYIQHHLPPHLMSETEDLVQETLAATWSATQKSTITNGDPGRYARGVARNKCAEAVRRHRRRPTVSLDEVADEPVASLIVSAAAEWALEQAEMVASLKRALRSLPPTEREILDLRYVDELDNKEASRRLGLAPEEGSRLKYVARARLRLILRGGKTRKRSAALRAVK